VTPAALRVFERQADTLLGTLAELATALERNQTTAARNAFHRARTAYKRTEPLLTLTSPLVSGWLNGPPAEDEDDFPRPPGVAGGFQIVEAALFPKWDHEAIAGALAQVARMREALADFRARTGQLPLREAEVLDAARLEIARISTLGLAGFDADATGAAVREASEAFLGMRELNASLSYPDTAVDRALLEAATYLQAHPDFERLNRLEFLVGYAAPAARAVALARKRWPGAGKRRQRLWSLDAPTVFDAHAFEPAAYASFDAPPAQDDLIKLGERLFFDPRLSGPGTRSCSTCHDPAHAFSDGKTKSPLLGAGLTIRNSPSLWNAAYQPVLFYDQRAASLEAQVDSVLANPQEMASSSRLAAERLQGDSALRVAFAKAFAGRAEAAVTGGSIQQALAAYVRSLTALNSRFDRALRGDTLVLTELERLGFNVFMGKGRCGTCHFLPFFNGTAPPLFTASEGEIIGVPVRTVSSGARLDPDAGRGGVDHLPEHLFAFKVPTLRNVTLTAPYMHNGAYRTLDQVIDFYCRGGGVGIGADVPGQTLPDRRLNLTPGERQSLIAFMGALVDTVRAGGE
jgi:cytochrome c peroxidase